MNAPIDLSNTVLNTRRLILRPWREGDLHDLYAYASVDGVGQMAGWLPHADIETSRRVLESFRTGRITFALEYGGKCIGSLGIERYDEAAFPELSPFACREIGFVLSKEFWGMGLMPEAVGCTLAWLFTKLRLDAVLCCHYARNTQSAKVQEKCGFSFYRRMPCTTRLGTVEDAVYNILHRQDWAAQQNEPQNAEHGSSAEVVSDPII